ncbi:hypothetical protein BDV12DRAFT_79259 [Aspergillus spectabilis]
MSLPGSNAVAATTAATTTGPATTAVLPHGLHRAVAATTTVMEPVVMVPPELELLLPGNSRPRLPQDNPLTDIVAILRIPQLRLVWVFLALHQVLVHLRLPRACLRCTMAPAAVHPRLLLVRDLLLHLQVISLRHLRHLLRRTVSACLSWKIARNSRQYGNGETLFIENSGEEVLRPFSLGVM